MTHSIFDLDAQYNRDRIVKEQDALQAEIASRESVIKDKDARIAALESRLRDAEEILTFIAYEDMQILENVYQAEEMATKWLDKNPGGDLV